MTGKAEMDGDRLGYFADDGDSFTPLPLAEGLWRTGQLHGVALSGLLARSLEQELVRRRGDELVPARYHVDLFRPAHAEPTVVEVEVVRDGPRVQLADARLLQHGEVMARAGLLSLKATEDPAGEVWSADDRAVPPPADVAPPSEELRVPFFASAKPWSDFFGDHQNAGRHATWQGPVPIIADETPTPFQVIAAVADTTNLVANWGEEGVGFINTDISLALCRRPASLEVGLRAIDHVSADGLAVGTAEVFDRAGTLGTATVTALANSRRSVDLGDQPHHTKAVRT